MKAGQKIFIIVFSLLLLLSSSFPSFADDATLTPSPTSAPDNSAVAASLQQQIQELQNKISGLQGQEKTLSSQIQVMDSQIKITQLRINATEQQISDLTLDIDTANKKITGIQSSLDSLTQVLMGRVVATYEVGTIQPLQVLLTSGTVADFLKRLDYLKIAQAHDKRLMYDTVQAKNDYQNQKNIYEDEKKQIEALKAQLQDYTTQLNQQKVDKQTLLSQTQGDEATYQRLLAQAEAQLAGFSSFVTSQGGASILSNQTVCDDWGCYYNQRDSQWGNVALGGSQYSIASDGCLMTSMAMVYTHYGHRGVTPLTINSNSNNFAAYNRAYLLKTITADGATSSRISGSIDSELSSGRPVIVGVSYDGGPIADHFVVLISGSGGSYQMNDPFTPNGHNISFTSHYSVGSIVEVDRVTF